jgi:hypothetical protein
MKRLSIIIGSILVVIVVGLFLSIPTESDFAQWMEDEYDVTCLDYVCHNLKIEVIEDGQSKVIELYSTDGGFEKGVFDIKVIRVYQNYNETPYRWDIEVRGFLGNFTVLSEFQRLTK